IFVVCKKLRQSLSFFFHFIDRKGYGRVHLIPAAHALKGLLLLHPGELAEILQHIRVIQHVPPKDGDDLLPGEEGGQDEADKEALGTVAAPLVLLAAGVAAAENVVELAALRKVPGDLELA